MFRRTIAVMLLYIGSQFAAAQSAASDDQSPYHGRVVTSPESLSGLWQAPDGHGGLVGLHLQLITDIPSTTTTLTGVQQTWEHLEVGVFQTKGPTLQSEDQNYFSDSPRGSNVRFENDRLSLHFASAYARTPSVDLDLTRAGDTWTGRFHRGDFDAQVELRRPAANADTWIVDSPMGRSCVHVPNSTAPEFNGWSDNIPTFGHVRFANNIPRPATSAATYGDLVKIRHLDDNKISIEFNAYGGMCCSHVFVGTITPDGMHLTGTWAAGPNQSPHPGSFRKAPPYSCLDSDPASFANPNPQTAP
jgi:hypothetical protein